MEELARSSNTHSIEHKKEYRKRRIIIINTYLEVKGDEGEDQCLQVLHKVVEYTQSLRVGRFSHVHQRADLGGLDQETS